MGNGGSKQGVRLRRGTEVEIDNAQIGGKSLTLAVESTETENALKNGISKLVHVNISGTLDSKEGIYTNEQFVSEGNLDGQSFAYSTLTDIANECTWMKGWTK